jgi:hypothetical protein
MTSFLQFHQFSPDPLTIIQATSLYVLYVIYKFREISEQNCQRSVIFEDGGTRFSISASNTTGASFGQVTSGSLPTSPSSLVLVTPSASFGFGRVVFGSLQWCMVKANVYRKKEWTEEDLPYQSFIPYQPPQYIYYSMPINNNQPPSISQPLTTSHIPSDSFYSNTHNQVPYNT